MRATEREAPLYVVDAFASRRFSGNPAAVMPLDRFEDDATLQAIAAENNLSETAFLVRESGEFHLRWFTPSTEVALCGHATLASAAVVLDRLEPNRDSVVFRSKSGPLTVRRAPSGYLMEFPRRTGTPVEPPPGLSSALGRRPEQLWVDPVDYLAVLPDETSVRAFRPSREALLALDRPGLIVTAPGRPPFDFVSRYFAPSLGVFEDPVTGSAHCLLAPYWADRLGKPRLRAFQASTRGGELECTVETDHVLLSGSCVFYAEGRARF